MIIFNHFKIKDNLVILFFLDLNIIFNLSHPSNHSQISIKFTLNPLNFSFNLLKVNKTSFTSDKGLIPTKDDGPWHMLRRKGVP